jgi:murein DD-endopeptidase MepM/ murein hydrolase activator NlpD
MNMEEPMNDTMERFRTFLRNNGFYIVLVLCLLAIGGIIAAVAIPRTAEEQAEATPKSDPIVIVGQSNDERLNEVLNRPKQTPTPIPTLPPLPTPIPTATAVPTAAPTVKPASGTSKVAPPVDGEVIFGFAIDKLLYSVTLDQWTTHPAVDIAAKEGTPVKCAFSGTVEQVKKDDTLGYLVRIQHTNGKTTLYANLGEDVRVKAGDRVSAGDVIGTVGASAISECALSPHLHFAVLVDGTPKDPAKYVRLK